MGPSNNHEILTRLSDDLKKKERVRPTAESRFDGIQQYKLSRIQLQTWHISDSFLFILLKCAQILRSFLSPPIN